MSNSSNAAPQVTLGQYKGLVITRVVDPVSEAAVEHEVVHQCRVNPNHVPTDAPAHRGSRVIVDFEGFMDGEPIPDSRMENVEAVLGSGTLMPAAEQAICGHCAGETFTFDFTYPEDFRVESLSGRTAQFRLVLHTVTEPQIPAADDAFARSRGYASLAAMHDAIRAEKQRVHEENADRKAGAALMEMAGANLTVSSLPTALLASAADQEMNRLRARLGRSDLALDTYCKRNNTTPEAIWKEFRAAAERRLRATLATRAIAEAENITVSRAEVEEEYTRLSVLHGTPEEEVRRALDPAAVAASIVSRKVQAFLLAHAVIQ